MGGYVRLRSFVSLFSPLKQLTALARMYAPDAWRESLEMRFASPHPSSRPWLHPADTAASFVFLAPLVPSRVPGRSRRLSKYWLPAGSLEFIMVYSISGVDIYNL